MHNFDSLRPSQLHTQIITRLRQLVFYSGEENLDDTIQALIKAAIDVNTAFKNQQNPNSLKFHVNASNFFTANLINALSELILTFSKKHCEYNTIFPNYFSTNNTNLIPTNNYSIPENNNNSLHKNNLSQTIIEQRLMLIATPRQYAIKLATDNPDELAAQKEDIKLFSYEYNFLFSNNLIEQRTQHLNLISESRTAFVKAFEEIKKLAPNNKIIILDKISDFKRAADIEPFSNSVQAILSALKKISNNSLSEAIKTFISSQISLLQFERSTEEKLINKLSDIGLSLIDNSQMSMNAKYSSSLAFFYSEPKHKPKKYPSIQTPLLPPKEKYKSCCLII